MIEVFAVILITVALLMLVADFIVHNHKDQPLNRRSLERMIREKRDEIERNERLIKEYTNDD